MNIGEANRGDIVWYICLDEQYPFVRSAEVVGQAALNTQSCIVKISSWMEGVDENGGPSTSRIMIPWMLLHHTKDEAIGEYVRHVEEQLITETRRYEQREQAEKEALCRPLMKSSSSSQTTDPGSTVLRVQPVTET